MGITEAKVLFCHGISEGNMDKEITSREYNVRKVFGCFRNHFTDNFGILDLYLPPMALAIVPAKKKEFARTLIFYQLPFLLPPKTFFVLWPHLTTPQLFTPLALIYLQFTITRKVKLDLRNNKEDIVLYAPWWENMQQKRRFYCSACSIHNRVYYSHGLTRKNQGQGIYFLKNIILWSFIQSIYVFAYPTSITPSAELDFWTCSLPVVLCPPSCIIFVYFAWKFYLFIFFLPSWMQWWQPWLAALLQ